MMERWERVRGLVRGYSCEVQRRRGREGHRVGRSESVREKRREGRFRSRERKISDIHGK